MAHLRGLLIAVLLSGSLCQLVHSSRRGLHHGHVRRENKENKRFIFDEMDGGNMDGNMDGGNMDGNIDGNMDRNLNRNNHEHTHTHPGTNTGTHTGTHTDDTCIDHHCQYGLCESTQPLYTCNCFDGWTGRHCKDPITTAAPITQNHHTTTETTTHPPTTTTASTTTRPTTTTSTTTSTPVPTTTTQPILLHNPTCSKFNTVAAIAGQTQASNQSAVMCPSGTRTSPEAFVLSHCSLPMPGFWKQGDNVMSSCLTLPLYTAIAEFGSFGYVSNPYTFSGVFLGCEGTPLGLKVAVQECDGVPTIVHIDAGGSRDPNWFFAIKY